MLHANVPDPLKSAARQLRARVAYLELLKGSPLTHVVMCDAATLQGNVEYSIAVP